MDAGSISFGNHFIETLKTYNLVNWRKKGYHFKARKTTTTTKI
jgi:hypothetical protein